MRTTFTLGAAAIATAVTFLHCASNEEAPTAPELDGGATWEAAVADGGASVDSDAADAALEDEFDIPDGAVTCEVSPCAVGISGSLGGSFCVLLADKTVQCWGGNSLHRLGYEADGGAFSSSPHRVPSLAGVTGLSAGDNNVCVTLEDGGIDCWGAGGLVGRGMELDGGSPPTAPAFATRQDLVPPAASVAVGENTACAVLRDGRLLCWGASGTFQLGRRTADAYGSPTSIPVGDRPISFVWPNRWVFATATSGEFLSWGADTCSQFYGPCSHMLVRDTSENPDPVPMLVARLSRVRAIASAPDHVCAITGKEVQCWGDDSRGQLARGSEHKDATDFPEPTILEAVANADDADAGRPARTDVPLGLAASAYDTCAVMGSGRVFCWRSNWPRDNWGRPVRVDTLSGPAVSVAIASETVCALLRTGAVECWGNNYLGLLGRGIDDVAFIDPKAARVVFEE